MIRVILEYEIDNSKQQLFIDVMTKTLVKTKELYPDVDLKYFFKWKGESIEKVFYFFDFTDEYGWNKDFDRRQTDSRWIDFVYKEYAPHKFVTPNTTKLQMIHELGTKPIEMELGAFDYSFDLKTGKKINESW